MQKWIIGALLGFFMQGSAMVGAVDSSIPLQDRQSLEKIEKEFATRSHHSHSHHCNIPGPTGPAGNRGPEGEGFQRFASYWLTNQPSLVGGQNVLFNLQQTLKGIQYDSTTGVFTLPAGVYVINFFATPTNGPIGTTAISRNTLNLNVNGTIIPNPSLEGATIVVELSADSNVVSVQATGNWSPQTDNIASYFFAYASIAIYQIGS